MIAQIPQCHPNRKQYAKGLCQSCYRANRKAIISVFAQCHPDRKHRSLGLCEACYSKQVYQKNTGARLRAHRKFKNSHPNRYENYRLARAYGITLKQKEEMLKIQNGKCKICRRTAEEAKMNILFVDHNHATKKVRGMLCRRCNLLVGFIEKNSHILETTFTYIKE